MPTTSRILRASQAIESRIPTIPPATPKTILKAIHPTRATTATVAKMRMPWLTPGAEGNFALHVDPGRRIFCAHDVADDARGGARALERAEDLHGRFRVHGGEQASVRLRIGQDEAVGRGHRFREGGALDDEGEISFGPRR